MSSLLTHIYIYTHMCVYTIIMYNCVFYRWQVELVTHAHTHSHMCVHNKNVYQCILQMSSTVCCFVDERERGSEGARERESEGERERGSARGVQVSRHHRSHQDTHTQRYTCSLTPSHARARSLCVSLERSASLMTPNVASELEPRASMCFARVTCVFLVSTMRL